MEIWPSLHIGEMIFFSKTFVHFRCVSPILDTKVSIKIQLRFTYGGFDTKKWLFFIMIFSISPTCTYFFVRKTPQNEVTYCENDVKKIFKKWKNHEILVMILLHVTQFWDKKNTFFRNIYIWVIWWKIHRNSWKNEKIWDFLTSFYNIWYYFNTKIQRFYQISTYG